MIDQLEKATRPVVTIVLAVTVCVGFMLGKISGDAFLAIANGTILFWFGARQAAKDLPPSK